MKRDLDLIRLILLWVEANYNGKAHTTREVIIPGYTGEQITLHIALLWDAQYIDNIGFSGRPWTKRGCFSRLTNSGYDYLDSVRDAKIWEMTKEKISEVIENITLDTVKAIAVKIALSLIGFC